MTARCGRAAGLHAFDLRPDGLQRLVLCVDVDALSAARRRFKIVFDKELKVDSGTRNPGSLSRDNCTAHSFDWNGASGFFRPLRSSAHVLFDFFPFTWKVVPR